LKDLEKSDSLKITQLDYHSAGMARLFGVTVFYGGKPACRPVSFSVEKGERIALAGPTGSGKSSILKLLNGLPLDYTGERFVGNQLKISYVSQETSFLTGSLDDYIRVHDLDESLFKAILRKLDLKRIQFEKNLDAYSGGQKKKVLIAKSLCEKAHLLLWDEPLNYIDEISRMQIEELLLEHAPTIVFVEHDRLFCEKIATKTVTL
jgi:lincosamide and streptogramin A transport system ATP-binding/permease protein